MDPPRLSGGRWETLGGGGREGGWQLPGMPGKGGSAILTLVLLAWLPRQAPGRFY